jgi:hypothetical protein
MVLPPLWPLRGRPVDGLEAGRDRDLRMQATVDRAGVLMHPQHPVQDLPVDVRLDVQPVGDVDAFDHQDLALEFDFADGLADQAAVAGGDLAGLQRTADGAGQSPARRRDDVVERGRHPVRVAPVVGRDLAVHAEADLLPGGQLGGAHPTLAADHPQPGPVDNLCHSASPLSVQHPDT